MGPREGWRNAVKKDTRGIWKDGLLRVMCEGPDADGVTCGRVISFPPRSLGNEAFRCPACRAKRRENYRSYRQQAPARMLSAVTSEV